MGSMAWAKVQDSNQTHPMKNFDVKRVMVINA
jgi:hypothetical protein